VIVGFFLFLDGTVMMTESGLAIGGELTAATACGREMGTTRRRNDETERLRFHGRCDPDEAGYWCSF
jgi:hypothetical protein